MSAPGIAPHLESLDHMWHYVGHATGNRYWEGMSLAQWQARCD